MTLPRAWLLFALFVLGLAARLGLLAFNRGALEVWEYDTLAQSIVAGHGYAIERWGHLAYAFGDGNLYSFLSAAVYAIVGRQLVVLAIVQAVLASLAAPVIFAIGERPLGRPAALLGSALAALHPGLLAYTLKLHPLGLDVLLLALCVWWIRRPAETAAGALGTGVALGLALMTRPTFFLAAVLALVVRAAERHRGRLVFVLVPVVVALLIAAPWVARNWAVLGRPLFISTSLEDVWKGNNPMASGSSYLPSGQEVFAAAPPELESRLRSATELEVNDVFASEIVAFVRDNPGEFVALTARKFAYFWWFSPQAGLLYPGAWLLAYGVYFLFAAGLGIVGLVSILSRGNPEERSLLATLAAIALTVAVIHALSYVEGRHRWGVEPLLLLLSAHGLLTSFSWLRSRWSASRSSRGGSSLSQAAPPRSALK